MSLPAAYIANQRWPYYRNLPPSLKTFGVVMAVVPTFIIAGETAGRRFEQDNWRVTPGSLRDQQLIYTRRMRAQGKSQSGSSSAYSAPAWDRAAEHDVEPESG